MKKLVILVICLMILSGCRQSDTEEDRDLYTQDKEVYLYTIDSTMYESAIEDLIYYSSWDIDTVNEVVDKHSALLTTNFISYYKSLASINYSEDGEDIEPPIIGELDDTEYIYDEYYDQNNYQYNDNLDSESNQYDDQYKGDESSQYAQDGQDDNQFHGDAPPDDDLDSSDNQFHGDAPSEDELELPNILESIVAYALEDVQDDVKDDEYWEIEPYEDNDKVYEVLSIDAYKDRLVASVSYKYGASMKVVVNLVDGKIDGYQIYR